MAIYDHYCCRNALKQIEEIRILRSYELSMGAVQQLIEACPRLRWVVVTGNNIILNHDSPFIITVMH